ncbi:GatB/YqeY domain-containing protein [Insolitispirillum peregrinum]|uniref:GatB/YqeY domain-containing protein n=1 Tax=Insolitispirillum peregrinum TaxID=80876 RepID=A0A1N7PLU7_9PROT|nr:GatB/YqeY domain-containing protein [Insolitispirillum peregrinum]SIT11460.1 hypothetical protein SAMN05421779_10765 [Insolitispirillum peregrinum]
MLRARLNESLKAALKAKEDRAVSTLRLILAALKDRDIAGRTQGMPDGIPDADILQMLGSMIKQRRESISMYEQGGRLELAEREREEIAIIETYLPKQMSEAEVTAAVGAVITELDAKGLKDMGRVMAALRETYAGQMDFAKASLLVKQQLS